MAKCISMSWTTDYTVQPLCISHEQNAYEHIDRPEMWSSVADDTGGRPHVRKTLPESMESRMVTQTFWGCLLTLTASQSSLENPKVLKSPDWRQGVLAQKNKTV